MGESGRRLGRTLKDLFLALLNATLILVALCLFLGWQLAETAQEVTQQVSQNLAGVQALRAEVQSMNAEVAGLRADLAAQGTAGGGLSLAAEQRLSAKLDAIDGGLAGARARMERMLEDPDGLLDRALDKAVAKLGSAIAVFRDCSPPAAS